MPGKPIHGKGLLFLEATGSLKSLRLFMAENRSPLGVRFAVHPLSFHEGILSIALYAVKAMPGLINQAL
jgi:hypothetical protein